MEQRDEATDGRPPLCARFLPGLVTAGLGQHRDRQLRRGTQPGRAPATVGRLVSKFLVAGNHPVD